VIADPARSATERPRVLFIINSLTGGGAERVMSTLLSNSEGWTERYDIALALLDDDARAFRLPEWLTVFQLDCRGRTLASIRAVDRVVREYDPAVTLSFLTRANFSSAIAMMKRGRPWIISERTSTPAHLGGAFRQLATKVLMRLVYPRATRVIAVSSGVAAKLSGGFGVPVARVDVIPNPVDIGAIETAAREENPLGASKPYIIAVGRLVSVKNYRMLIEAFAKANLPCRLVIAGDGPERGALEKLADQLGLEDRVILPGWLSNPYPALGNASAFVLSSDVEGFPNALVEALGLGIPSVATNCADGPAEILDGSTLAAVSGLKIAEAGILTPVGDVGSYARALRLVFQQPLRGRLVAAGRRRANDYSAAAIIARYWDVMEAALPESGASRASRPRAP
jgi:glycosyltransferase involved in cell wall biosynthesis